MLSILESLKSSLETAKQIAEDSKGTIKDNMDDLCDILEDEILKSPSSEEEKKALLKRLRKFCNTETNIMLVGATGCGKSSTINALFAVGEDMVPVEDKKTSQDEKTSEDKETSEEEGSSEDEDSSKDEENIDGAELRSGRPYFEVAKVGTTADPETRDIEKYRIGNLVLWDTPGLGDGTEIDEHHRDVITELLRKKDEDGNALIDLVLVILDGSTKDLGTSYKLLNDVIIPELKGDTPRILIALNQADIAMKTGRHWDFEKNEPDETLVKYLEDKVQSIRVRIKEDSGLDIKPVYYCAGYEEENGDVVRPYNLSKLLYYIMRSLPAQKRVAVMEGINTDSGNYEHNDDEEDYNEGIKDSFCDSVDCISKAVDSGAEIGETLLGIPGAIVGAIIGGVVGCVKSILDDIF